MSRGKYGKKKMKTKMVHGEGKKPHATKSTFIDKGTSNCQWATSHLHLK